MKKFAYIDKAGIMHIVESADTAKEYSANGKFVETEIAAKYGYPLNDEGIGVIVYSTEEMKLDAEGNTIDPIPALAELYRKCM